ncbi:choice-of-anchor E domain-containing protein [Herbaspirillum sp. NPDC087042]|uniref:PEP-CTERM sorting domain-containing protein n=1 Tax=Herbaspirillum sp. NPDC087042 TaxID=3364004 RepID=UPI00380542D5
MAAAPASATTLTTSWQSANFSLASVDGTAQVNFAGFDSSLGTLVGVTIKYIVNETLSDLVYNSNNYAVTVGNPVGLSATSTITVTGPLGLTTVSQLTTSPLYAGNVGSLADNNNQAAVVATNTVTGIASPVNTITGNPTTLASYLGASNTVTIGVKGVGSQSGSLPPGVFNSYSGSSNGVVYLQYIYDIPEPASIALFAVGLLALTQLRRRKS